MRSTARQRTCQQERREREATWKAREPCRCELLAFAIETRPVIQFGELGTVDGYCQKCHCQVFKPNRHFASDLSGYLTRVHGPPLYKGNPQVYTPRTAVHFHTDGKAYFVPKRQAPKAADHTSVRVVQKPGGKRIGPCAVLEARERIPYLVELEKLAENGGAHVADHTSDPRLHRRHYLQVLRELRRVDCAWSNGGAPSVVAPISKPASVSAPRLARLPVASKAIVAESVQSTRSAEKAAPARFARCADRQAARLDLYKRLRVAFCNWKHTQAQADRSAWESLKAEYRTA